MDVTETRAHEAETTASQKRARNRLAQQAFRRRQNTKLKDLERQIANRGKSNDEYVLQLEEENKALREQLAATVSKLESVQVTLKTLSDSLTHVTTKDDEPEIEHVIEAQPSPPIPAARTEYLSSAVRTTSPSNTGRSQQAVEERVSVDVPIPFEVNADVRSQDAASYSTLNELVLSPNTQAALEISMSAWPTHNLTSLPGVWSHGYQMGPAAFTAYLAQTDVANASLPRSNSSFSDHMCLLRRAVSKKWRASSSMQLAGSNTNILRLCVSIALSLFNSINRPEALAWYTATNYSQNIVDVTIWQISRSRDAYLRLPVNYRPTGLQLTESYPSVIDWCPFPTIRDRLILLHAANPQIDQMICEIATCYVVEVDTAELVQQAAGRGYIRVWDLIYAMSKTNANSHGREPTAQHGVYDQTIGSAGERTTTGHLPATSVEQLFTRQPARTAFKKLGLGDGIPRFKLDPALFVKYPELYDPGTDIMASGRPIAPVLQTSIPTPTPPAVETRHIYWHSVDWSLTALCKGLGGVSAF